MKLQLKRSRPWAVIYGLITSAILLAAGFMVMNQPQCHLGQEEQLGPGGCIVGANIGLGLLVMAMPIVIIGCVIIFLAFMAPKSKNQD